MDWTPHEYNVELEFQSEEFIHSNFKYLGVSGSHLKTIDVNQQRKNDEKFINNFILQKQKRKINSKSNFKISEAKILFLEIIREKKNIEKNILNLDVNDQNFNLNWETLVTKLNTLNRKISKFSSDIKTPLAAALKKRLKKRKAIKERKEKLKVIKKSREQEIHNKHKTIDKLLNERSEEVEVVKHEAALKRQADTVLHEVQKKKYEAKKMLNLLVALAKLRELRSKEEEKRGGYCSKVLTRTFNKVMSTFQSAWEKQLEVYKLEEKGLKIMLEENTLPHKKESKLETNLLQWEKVLFGDVTDNEHEKLLTMAETDVQTMIQIRRDWDQFLTSKTTLMASGIPLGWVLPSETEDKHWKAFMRSSNKISL